MSHDGAGLKRERSRWHAIGMLIGSVFAILVVALPSGHAALAEDPPAAKALEGRSLPAPPASPAPAGTAKTPAVAVPEAIDHQPYRIELHLALDPSARIDDARRLVLLRQWLALVHRFVGPPWIVTIASHPSPLAGGSL